MRLREATVLVTGSSAGIGRSTAAALAAAGADVIVHGRDAERTRATAAEVGGVGVVADLSNPDGPASLADQAMRVRGRVDVLVNNAGYGWSGAFAGMPPGDISTLITTDLTASILLTHALLEQMLSKERGHVCFVSSVAGQTAVAGEAVYGAAKAGIVAFADSLRLEAAGCGVEVSVVVPAAVDTGFFDRRGRPYDRRIPRPIPPDTVAEAVVRAVENNRPETWTPRWVRAAAVVRALAPNLYRKLSAKYGEQVRPRDPT